MATKRSGCPLSRKEIFQVSINSPNRTGGGTERLDMKEDRIERLHIKFSRQNQVLNMTCHVSLFAPAKLYSDWPVTKAPKFRPLAY